MDAHTESQSFEAIPHHSSSVLSYSSLPTAVDENALHLRHNPSVLSVDQDNEDSDDPTRRSIESITYSRRNSHGTIDDPLQSHPESDSGEPSSDPTLTPFKQATISPPELIQPKGAPTIWKAIAYRWYPEIIWSIISTGCFLALILVLIHYDEKPLPKWPLGLTINTVIALLATFSRTGFVLPVCESISQLKWLWYRKERPLADLQMFDEASRGPWGSLKLLMTMRTKAWVLALLPALVMTTSVLTSTLTQSVVTYPTRLEPVYGLPIPTLVLATSSLERSSSYDGFSNKIASEVNTGLNYPIEDEFDINRPSCATGECRWPLFDTIEVCTKTWNITKYVNFATVEGNVANISIPNGAFQQIDVATSDTDFVWLANGYDPVSYNADSSPLTNTTLLNFIATYIPCKGSPMAVEVVFHLCVNRYNLTVRENVISRCQEDTSVETDSGLVEFGFSEDPAASMSYILSPGGGSTKFPFDMYSMSTVLESMLYDIYDGPASGSGYSHPATRFAYLFQTALGEGLNGPPRKDGDPVTEMMKNVSRNIAASLSKGITISNDMVEVEGENLGPVVFVKVRWPWLILLGSQILLSLIFVTIVITRTALSNLGVTKSSLLPTLFAINPEERALLEKSTDGNKQMYHEEFTKIANQATGVVGKFSPGTKGRGWVLTEAKAEMQ